MKILNICLVLVFMSVPVFTFSAASSYAQNGTAATKMNITGKIVKMDNRYIIRGTAPHELFRILNPDPAQLETLAGSDKTVSIVARIVVGDNVTIESIDGKQYTPK